MTLLINGDDGSVGVFIEKRNTDREGIVDVIYQPPSTSFLEVLKSLFKRPTKRIRNVPESSILGPIIVGPSDDQKQILFMLQGENASSKFLNQTKLLFNRTITDLRQQLQDELIRSQAAEEEKRSVLRGAKQTQKMLEDLKRDKRRPPLRREGWGEQPEEEQY